LQVLTKDIDPRPLWAAMVRKRGLIRRLAALETMLLAAMVALSGGARPPLVSISDIALLEAGAEASVVGLVAENWLYESGSEGLLLADPLSTGTLRVICVQAVKPMPSRYLSIGDEIAVRGEVSKSATGLCLIATSDGIQRLRTSAAALTVAVLCENWMVFLNDRLLVRGILLVDEAAGGWRLGDAYSDGSLRLDLECPPPPLSARTVEVEGSMVLDKDRMELVLVTYSVLPVP